MSPKRIISTVTNDLVGDQRIHKAAMSLKKAGWDPVLVGRRMRDSETVDRAYRTKRFRLLFNHGPLFYMCFNFRLFCYLLRAKADLFLANDLDTLPAVWFASLIRNKPYVFDSHEYFTEVPELVNRKHIQKIWKSIERFIIPKTKYMLTVNHEIAQLFREEYDVSVGVLMNVPSLNSANENFFVGEIPVSFNNRTLILYQGAVNAGRGLEEILETMTILPDHVLLVLGGGDNLKKLQLRVKELNLQDQVCFKGRLAMNELAWYTQQAKIGLSVEQDLGLNYRLALPNKLFDYMHAGLPVLASDLPVMARIVKEVNFGLLTNLFDPKSLASKILEMTSDQQRYQEWKVAALKGSKKYTWESQESILLDICEQATQ